MLIRVQGSHDIETPAEIDGLLDDYFDTRIDMPYDDLTGEMVESQHSSSSDTDGSRRGRPLFADAESARRNIMRLPSAFENSTNPSSDWQDSPLAGRGRETNMSLSVPDVRTLQRGRRHPAQEIHSSSEASLVRTTNRRESSLYPPSKYSDPFDLYVTDDEREPDDTIDNTTTDQPATRNDSHPEAVDQAAQSAKDDGDADAEAYVLPTSRSLALRFMSTLTRCFIPQDHQLTRARHDPPQHNRLLRP